MDTFDFEMARLFCQRALDIESNNLHALDMLGHIYSELGNTQKAKEISFARGLHFIVLISFQHCHFSLWLYYLNPFMGSSSLTFHFKFFFMLWS